MANQTTPAIQIKDSNVGIGTNSPLYKLNVIGDISFPSRNTAGTYRIGMGREDGNGWTYTQNIAFISDGGGGYITFSTQEPGVGGGEYMRLNYTGNLLIGTTTDAGYKLDVNGTVRIANTLRIDGFDTVGAQRAIGFGGNTLGTNPTIYSNGSYLSVNSKNSAILYLNSDSSGNVVFNGGGNVGIGTTNPGAKLEVIDEVRVTSSGAYASVTTRNTGATGGGGFLGYQNGVANAFFGVAGWYLGNTDTGIIIGTDSSSRPIRFYTNFEQMRITGGGNVLIGTTTDSGDKLFVNGSVKVDSGNGLSVVGFNSNTGLRLNYGNASGEISVINMIANGITNGYIGIQMVDSSNGDLWFGSSGNRAMTIYRDRNVGIGTTSPSALLHVAGGNIMVSNTVSPGAPVGGIIFKQTNSSGFDIAQIQGIAGATVVEGILALSTKDSGGTMNERMRITAAGNVGIGTTAPSEKLVVNASSGANSIIYAATDTGQAGLKLLAGTGSTNRATRVDFLNGVSSGTVPRWTLINDYNQNGTNDFRFVKDDQSTSVLTLLQGGNVGIGTTSPSQKLHLYGSGNQLMFIENAGTYHMYVGLSSNVGIIGSNNATPLSLQTNGGSRVYIDTSGNVGIGTTSPSVKLDVRTDDGVLIKGASSTIDARIALVPASGGRQYGLRNYGSSFGIKDESADVIRMYFHYDGNLGIGTTSPSVKLHTVGDGLFYSNTNTNLTINSNGGVATLTLTNGAGSQVIYGGVGGSNNMDFYTGSTFRMRIDPSGNVGIGTTSPREKLQVVGNTVIGSAGLNSYKTNLYLTYNATTDETWFRIYLPQDYVSSNNGGTVKVRVLWEGDHATFGAYQEYQISYKTYYPASPYIKFSNVLCMNKTSDFNTGSTYYPPSSAPDVLFYDNSDGYLYAKVKGIHSSYNTARYVEAEIFGRTTSQPTIATTTAPSTPVELTKTIQILPQEGNLYVSNSVGIGTTSPSTKLEVGNFLDAVTNKITVAARYEYEPEFNFRLGQSGTNLDWVGAVISSGDDGNYNGKILFKTANAGRDTPTTKMVIKASGNVGIGTTSPSSPFTVATDVRAASLNAADLRPQSQVNLLGGGGDSLFIGQLTNSFAYIQSSYFNTTLATYPILLNPLGGNVLIGTTTDSGYKLNVNGTTFSSGNITTDGYVFANSEGLSTRIRVGGIHGNLGLYIDATYNMQFDLGWNGAFTWTRGNAEKMRLTYDGKVGIGTTAPTNIIHVVGVPRFDSPSDPPTRYTGALDVDRYYGTNEGALTSPEMWLKIDIDGTSYLIPAFEI